MVNRPLDYEACAQLPTDDLVTVRKNANKTDLVNIEHELAFRLSTAISCGRISAEVIEILDEHIELPKEQKR